MKKLNIDLILTTGRDIHYVKKMCKKFTEWRCIVAENGAVIYSINKKQLQSTHIT
ncbi:MAG: HAD hydrolase family protein [Candidatus Aenigmarchaeota archaeon]|nr:HAD hydrolase family protein [Candidatus Aenigmarchaeota archaeon]